MYIFRYVHLSIVYTVFGQRGNFSPPPPPTGARVNLAVGDCGFKPLMFVQAGLKVECRAVL